METAMNKPKTTVGTHNLAHGNHILNLAIQATLPPEQRSPEQINGLVSLFKESQVNTPIEAMLISQMASLHANAMRIMAIATANSSITSANVMFGHANKLMRSFALHVEAYEKLKRGGRQNIRVDHVHVHQGGQAIVGNIQKSSKEA